MKKRERRTNLEALGGVSGETLRVLRATAREADLPLSRVFRDCLAIGVSVIGNPETSPYTSLVTFRRELEQYVKRERSPGETAGPDGADLDVRGQTLAETVHDEARTTASEPEEPDPNGSLDASLGSGFEPEDGTVEQVLSLG